MAHCWICFWLFFRVYIFTIIISPFTSSQLSCCRLHLHSYHVAVYIFTVIMSPFTSLQLSCRRLHLHSYHVAVYIFTVIMSPFTYSQLCCHLHIHSYHVAVYIFTVMLPFTHAFLNLNLSVLQILWPLRARTFPPPLLSPCYLFLLLLLTVSPKVFFKQLIFLKFCSIILCIFNTYNCQWKLLSQCMLLIISFFTPLSF